MIEHSFIHWNVLLRRENKVSELVSYYNGPLSLCKLVSLTANRTTIPPFSSQEKVQ